jgi:hypothetical protein
VQRNVKTSVNRILQSLRDCNKSAGTEWVSEKLWQYTKLIGEKSVFLIMSLGSAARMDKNVKQINYFKLDRTKQNNM